jgi:hypothetical protein
MDRAAPLAGPALCCTAMRPAPLRLMIYDRTCTGPRLRPGLSHAWWTGGVLYGKLLRRLHAWHGVRSWAEGLAWLAQVQRERAIAEVQFWGHGKWGRAYVGRDVLDRDALGPGHPLHAALAAVRERLVGPEALWWFRTCETFGALPGHEFAQGLTDYLGCRAAGHTYIIGGWQSGLHSLRPGERPGWSPLEGLKDGAPEDPREALWSRRREPNTIHFLSGVIPAGY